MPQWIAEAVGADRVWTRGTTVVVESAADMPEWELRQYRRTAIVVGGQRYAVVEKRLLDGGGYRYVLEPWPEGADVPGRTVVYDAEYANARDAAARLATRRDRVGKALFFVGPLLGLLPAPGQAGPGRSRRSGTEGWNRPLRRSVRCRRTVRATCRSGTAPVFTINNWM